MTPGQRRWLENLRDNGPQKRPRYGAYPMAQCVRNKWTKMNWVDAESGDPVSDDEVIARNFKRVTIIESITSDGLVQIGEAREATNAD